VKCFDSLFTLTFDLLKVLYRELDVVIYVAGPDRIGRGEDAREKSNEDERGDLRLIRVRCRFI